jgi:2-dehydropantoate 2-reductase
MTHRKILIVGCGAMGGVFAAALADACDLTVYDANAAHMAAIRDHGLRVTGASTRTARLRAESDPAKISGPFDAAIFLIKTGATARALADLRPALTTTSAAALTPNSDGLPPPLGGRAGEGGKPLLVTLQNGMGGSDVLLGMPAVPVARGVTMQAGRYVGPGQVEHLIAGESWIGPVRGSADEMSWLGELLTGAGMPTKVIPDPMGAVWAKFVFNSVMNPVGALLLGDNRARYEVAEVRALIDDMADECMRTVEALGGRFAFDPMDFVKKVRSGAMPMSKHAGSMSLDIARGAPTEIDELTGFVVREAERLGIPVPNCRAVYRLVKGLELAAANQARGT